jgi:hypothetical protein
MQDYYFQIGSFDWSIYKCSSLGNLYNLSTNYSRWC